jgi:hypothetical protein
VSNELAKLYDHFVPGYREGAARDEGGASLLTPELLRKIREERSTDPEGTLERARRAFGGVESLEDVDRVIDHLEWVFEHPDAAIEGDAVAKGPSLPSTFRFDGLETGSSFQHNPDSKKFSDSDWTGFGINCGTQLLKRKFTSKAPFRWHRDFPSKFEYSLVPNAKVALFADFATGLAHSFYVAKFIAAAKPDATIHLGDIYYSGKTPEVAAHYDMPLFPLVSQRELWTLPGNHDYFSGGAPYFKNLDDRRRGIFGGHEHRQEGSYFCLDSPAFRLIGIDGEYHSGTRYNEEPLQRWLAEKIAEAKSAGRTVILLSSDEPYSHSSERGETLLQDITANLPPNAIDLWFWGNTHYCALFKPSDKLRPKFHGSCIGHGGYQYKRLVSKPSPSDIAPILWAETEPRFPSWTSVRQDMGNNGFCIMQLDDNARSVTLVYTDWTNAARATISFATVERRLQVQSVTAHPRPACK